MADLTTRVMSIPVTSIRHHPANVRRQLGDLRDLSESIRAQGVLQPLLVERRATVYRLLAGHRRLEAARMAGLRAVPCLVTTEQPEATAIMLMLAENVQRSGLTLDEKRDAASRLQGLGVGVATIAKTVGVATSTVYAWLTPADSTPLPATRPSTTTPPRPARPATPRVKPVDVATVVTTWRERAADGLDAAAAAQLLDDVDALIGGWRPSTPGAASV